MTSSSCAVRKLCQGLRGLSFRTGPALIRNGGTGNNNQSITAAALIRFYHQPSSSSPQSSLLLPCSSSSSSCSLYNNWKTRSLSTEASLASSLFPWSKKTWKKNKTNKNNNSDHRYTPPKVVKTEDGREFVAFDMREHPKLKPSIVRKRLAKMKTYVGSEKNIRHSPWRLNLVCQFVAGMPLQEALTQLEFCHKVKAPLVQKVLKRTSNLADIRDGIQMSQLEVAECFATRGTPLKRIKIMGRGRAGRMERKHSHMRVVLREVDFKLRIYQAKTLSEKKRWFQLQQEARRDYARAKADRDEIRRLEKQAAAAAAKGKATSDASK